MNAELMALMLKSTPMDGAANYKYYMNQYCKFHHGTIPAAYESITQSFQLGEVLQRSEAESEQQ
ncbi:MAG: hypothetical protein WDO15_00175 [Bacteroidota bacterium]